MENFDPFAILPDEAPETTTMGGGDTEMEAYDPFCTSSPDGSDLQLTAKPLNSDPCHVLSKLANIPSGQQKTKRIDDGELLQMLEAGATQKEAADRFGVSEAAVSQKLRRLRKQITHAAVLEPLSDQQRHFVAEVCSGARQTEAALASYNCLPDSAKAIGNKLMKDEKIRRAIDVIMEEQGLSREHLIRRLRQHVDDVDAQVSLRAVDMGLRLHDAFPVQKRANVNLNIDTCPIDLSGYM